MLYFNLFFNKFKDKKKQELINFRKKRTSILKQPIMGKIFTRGDILTVNFWCKTYRYHFEGICLSLKKKKITKPNVTIILRNILFKTGVEMCMSYYSNRLFRNTFMSDFKRKNFNYKLSKLYYLRYKENQATKIKY